MTLVKSTKMEHTEPKYSSAYHTTSIETPLFTGIKLLLFNGMSVYLHVSPLLLSIVLAYGINKGTYLVPGM